MPVGNAKLLHKVCRPDHYQQELARQPLSRWNSRELAPDEFEIALDRREVGARLIGFGLTR